MAEKIRDDIDAIVNLSGGLECAAALWYAVAKGYNPVALHLYNKEGWGNVADAQLAAAQEQADHMGVRLLVDEANMPQQNRRNNYPVLQHLSAISTLMVGNPFVRFKAIIWGANSDDSFRQRLQLKFPFRAIACGWSQTLDPHGIKPHHIIKLPTNVFPFEWMQKSELVAMLLKAEPKLLEMVWSCTGELDLMSNGKYLPCGKCDKCIELTYSKKVAWKSVHKIQEGSFKE